MAEAGSDEQELGEQLRRSMLDLLARRAPTSTICPSDAARVVGGAAWRDLMDPARRVAYRLAGQDVVEVRQRGVRVADPDLVRGPVRLSRGPRFDADAADRP